MDLDKIEHMTGKCVLGSSFMVRASTYIQLQFYNVSSLMDIRKDIMEALKSNHRSNLSMLSIIESSYSNGRGII